MKRILLLAVFVFCFFASRSQSTTTFFKKLPVGNSGTTVYSYCDLQFEKTYSDDSSTVYTAECTSKEVSYGVICVKLSTVMDDLEKAETVMINYVDYLKTSFGITKSMGAGKGHRLNNKENTRGIMDYWEDAEKNNWKMKAWTDGKFICVLYGYSQKELPEEKVNVFLDGFRLPN